MLVSSLTSQVVTKSMAALTSRPYFSPFVAPSDTTYISKSEHELNTLLLHRTTTRTKLPLQYSACSSYQPDLLLMSGQSASQVSLINGFKNKSLTGETGGKHEGGLHEPCSFIVMF